MCGRVTKTKTEGETELKEIIDPRRIFSDLSPRFNIAPSQVLCALRLASDGERELVSLTWGLAPRWLKSLDKAIRPINAMSETVSTKPYFRNSYRDRRCLVLADGYYEWKQERNLKQPYYTRMKDASLFWIAGLWDLFAISDNLETCVLLTTVANSLCSQVHDRMPVIIGAEHVSRWLGETGENQKLDDLLTPYDPTKMEAFPVSTYVNNPRNQGPKCIEPLQSS